MKREYIRPILKYARFSSCIKASNAVTSSGPVNPPRSAVEHAQAELANLNYQIANILQFDYE